MRPKPLLIAVILVGLALVVYFAAQPIENRSGLPSLSESALDLRVLDQKLEPVARAIAESRLTGRSQPVMLQISESEFFSKIADWSRPGLPLIGINSGEAYLGADGVIFFGEFNLARIDFQFRIDFSLRIEDAARELTLEHAQIGELTAPEWFRNVAVTSINATFNAGLPRVPIDTRTLIISDQSMVISGVTLGI